MGSQNLGVGVLQAAVAVPEHHVDVAIAVEIHEGGSAVGPGVHALERVVPSPVTQICIEAGVFRVFQVVRSVFEWCFR